MFPYNTLQLSQPIYPLFGDLLKGPPLLLDLSFHNPELADMDMTDQVQFQQYIEQKLGTDYSWGVSGYLEFRSTLLGHLPQMKADQRFFHLGLDVMVPVGAPLYAPLDGVVEETGYEPGTGNFGGYVLLRHEGDFETFYSLNGHLNPDSFKAVGTTVKQGEAFATIGDFSNNGNWFPHTHLQILTKKGYIEGYLSKGYCTSEMLPEIQYLCPSPLHLFRY